MATLIRIHGSVLLVAALCVPAVQAQQSTSATNDSREQPAAPYAAGRTPFPAILFPGSSSDSDAGIYEEPTTEVHAPADDQPLSGVQEVTLGSNLGVKNLLVPSISATSQLAANSTAVGSGSHSTFNF